jgi:hypothetical protein
MEEKINQDWIDVDLRYLEKLSRLAKVAPMPKPGHKRVIVRVNNTFSSSSGVSFKCGHWFDWLVQAWFHTLNDSDDILCPGCLPGRVRKGSAVIDRATLVKAIKFLRWGPSSSADWC